MLNKIRPGECHQRIPNDPKFEDWFQVETEWQGHWARVEAWKLAKKIFELMMKKLHSFRLRKNGVSILHPKLTQSKESFG